MEDFNIDYHKIISIKDDVNEISENFKNVFGIQPNITKSMNIRKVIKHITLSDNYRNNALTRFGDGYYKYCENEPYWLGCTIGHYVSISTAKDMKLPYIAIFEDDSIYKSDIHEKLKTMFSMLPSDFDTFVFGYDVKTMLRSYQPNPISYNDLIYRGVGFKHCGSTAYIINSKAYDKVLSILDDMYVADVAINKSELSCYYSKESLCNQPQFI